MICLSQQRLCHLINGSIPILQTQTRIPAKKQISHILDDVSAYLGDLPYDYNERVGDLPFKTGDDGDDEIDNANEDD